MLVEITVGFEATFVILLRTYGVTEVIVYGVADTSVSYGLSATKVMTLPANVVGSAPVISTFPEVSTKGMTIEFPLSTNTEYMKCKKM